MIENLPYPSIARIMEVTAFKTEQKAEAALATLMWLDNGAPHKFNGCEQPITFDMGQYIRHQYLPHNGKTMPVCGTACCIAGAISLHMAHGKIESDKGHRHILHAFDAKWDREDALSRLFFPMTKDEDGIPKLDSKTPEQAAYTLRQYLFTGETVWK